MSSRFTPISAAFAGLVLTSCYVMPEDQQIRPPLPNGGTVTSPEQQAIEQQRQDLAGRETPGNTKPVNPPPANNNPPVENPGTTKPTPPPQEVKKTDYAYAIPVPGKEGLVFSPYNNKQIDVRGIPTGTLVQDPTYPPADKKYFRVP